MLDPADVTVDFLTARFNDLILPILAMFAEIKVPVDVVIEGVAVVTSLTTNCFDVLDQTSELVSVYTFAYGSDASPSNRPK